MSASPRAAFEAELLQKVRERIGLSRVQLAPDQLERLWAAVSSQPSAASLALPGELGGGYLAWDELVDASTVRETYFFRHPEQLDLLRRHALPELRGQPGGLVRAWSAGCASGEEAYTLAMLFAEEALLERAYVLGTDICRRAIDTALDASYREWSLRGLAPEQLARHFERRGAQHCVRESLRRRVTFRVLNLTEACYPMATEGTAGLSLICCRNVLMFLDHSSVSQIAARLYDALAPGGFLLTGPSDPALSGVSAWDVLVTRAGLLYQKPRRPRSTSEVRASRPAPDVEALPEPPPLPPLAANAEPTPSLTPAAIDPERVVRELWDARGAAAALASCGEALARAPGALELNHLRALLLWDLGQHAEAVSAMRRVLYLDSKLAVAHFGLAALYERTGDAEAAVRCYRNVLACCEGAPADAELPLGDGLCVEGLCAAARHSLLRLAAGQVSA